MVVWWDFLAAAVFRACSFCLHSFCFLGVVHTVWGISQRGVLRLVSLTRYPKFPSGLIKYPSIHPSIHPSIYLSLGDTHTQAPVICFWPHKRDATLTNMYLGSVKASCGFYSQVRCDGTTPEEHIIVLSTNTQWKCFCGFPTHNVRRDMKMPKRTLQHQWDVA